MIQETHKEEVDFLIKHYDKHLPEVLRLFAKMKVEQYAIHGVVDTLPNAKSKEFLRWTQSKGYASCFNGLWYSKGGVDYSTEVLHRHFANELEFGN